MPPLGPRLKEKEGERGGGKEEEGTSEEIVTLGVGGATCSAS
jgi:hypothetical protein